MIKNAALRADPGQSLTLDQMKARFPTIFAAKAHFSRSETFVHIDTSDVVNKLMAEGFQPVEARASWSNDIVRRMHNKHMLRFRSVQAKAVGDTVFEVILRNASDGSSSYEFFTGLFRLICTNGMVADIGEAGRMRVRHTGNRERQLAAVATGAHAILQTAAIALEAPRQWSQIELSRDEQLELAGRAHKVRFGDSKGRVKTPILPAQLLSPRRAADVGTDLWRTFQRIQENAIKGGLVGTEIVDGVERTMTSRPIKAVDGDIKLNTGLWQVADGMAKYKTGGESLALGVWNRGG